jgi:CHASE3 domain sensor protein
MFKKIALSLALSLVVAGTAGAANYIEPQQLKQMMD